MVTETQDATIAWWHDYWDRSYILINPNASGSDPGFQVGKNYQYFRYMMGCNAKGKYPMRFNGGLFTFDPVLTDPTVPFTPDFRRWSGGTFTAQNQRLLYWPLLKTGDWDIMQRKFHCIWPAGLEVLTPYRGIQLLWQHLTKQSQAWSALLWSRRWLDFRADRQHW